LLLIAGSVRIDAAEAALMANLALPQIEAIRDHVGRLGLREMTILKYAIASVGTIA
jgi:hypothetical protein